MIILEWFREWQFWFALASLVGGIFAAWKYFNVKKQQEFDNYHKLIERINKPLGNDEETYSQVQQAAIFELRYYKRYKKLSIGLMEQLLERWESENLRNSIVDTLKILDGRIKTVSIHNNNAQEIMINMKRLESEIEALKNRLK